MLLLHTTGRHSGRHHTIPLLYLRRGDDLVIIASWGGRERHPEWYLNLVADPAASVTVMGRRRRVAARTTFGAERAALWEAAVAAHGGYAGYQAKTTRQIPVVVLEG
jgi:deazaflavin-dependent oxidoreductase (nitroreductase family)